MFLFFYEDLGNVMSIIVVSSTLKKLHLIIETVKETFNIEVC